MEQIQLAYGLSKETVTAIMMLHKGNGLLTDINFLGIITGVLQGNKLVPYVYNLPILYTSNVDRSNNRKWFYIKKRREADNILQKLEQLQTTQMI